MTNDEDGKLNKMSIFKKRSKIHFLGQKWHFLGLGKQPKTDVWNELKRRRKKLPLGCLQPILYPLFSFQT